MKLSGEFLQVFKMKNINYEMKNSTLVFWESEVQIFVKYMHA